MPIDSGQFFALIDNEGRRRVPRVINARDGRSGYAVHPAGKGNDSAAAIYTRDERKMVHDVVFHGHGVRAAAEGGPQDGQTNTLGLDKKSIKGYWLCPSKFEWVRGASVRPLNEAGGA